MTNASYDGKPVTIAEEESHQTKTMYRLDGAVRGWVFSDDDKLEVETDE